MLSSVNITPSLVANMWNMCLVLQTLLYYVDALNSKSAIRVRLPFRS